MYFYMTIVISDGNYIIDGTLSLNSWVTNSDTASDLGKWRHFAQATTVTLLSILL